MNISLTPELAQFVAERVDGGLYTSASEVVREGLRLLLDGEKQRELRLTELRAKVQEGIDQARRGEVVDGPATMKKLIAKVHKRRSRAR